MMEAKRKILSHHQLAGLSSDVEKEKQRDGEKNSEKEKAIREREMYDNRDSKMYV